VCRVEDPPPLEKQLKHTIDVVVDRIVPGERHGRSRLAEAVELALKHRRRPMVIVAAEPAGKKVPATSRRPTALPASGRGAEAKGRWRRPTSCFRARALEPIRLHRLWRELRHARAAAVQLQ
jgi:excinuclease ABC subunit A